MIQERGFQSSSSLHLSLKVIQSSTSALLVGETANRLKSEKNLIKCCFLRTDENQSTCWNGVENEQTKPIFGVKS